MPDKYRVKPNDKINLKDYSTDYKGDKSKDELRLEAIKNITQIVEYQQKLFAEGKQSLLVVIQALDAGGKDGTVRNVFGPINPQGCIVHPFRAPTKLELEHDFLWRVHPKVPRQGMIAVFNRSHYEDVLIVKVNKWIDDDECKQRYEHINNFEKLLADKGTKILKFYLHITKDEQKARFQKRLDNKDKNWKFNPDDLETRKQWDKYQKQFAEVFEHTSTKHAPWYIISANNKSFRNVIISDIVLKAFKEMEPQFPKSDLDVNSIVID